MAGVRGPEQPIVNVVGELVALGPLRRDLLPTYQRWINDLAAADRIGLLPQPWTIERETEWYEASASATDWVSFTVYERTAWRPVGTCGLIELDHRHGTAAIVMHIGDTADRGKGYGTGAVRLLLDYAFTALGLHNVMLGVDETKLAGRRAYEKAGFKEIGRRRQSIRRAGRRSDEILMDCLASEFTGPVLGRVFAPDEPRP